MLRIIIFFRLKIIIMHKFFTFLLFLISITSYSQVGWTKSFEDAQKLAIATDRLILVDFWATWCGPCKKMESESWSDIEIGKMSQGYVPLKIDLDKRTALAMRYGVNAIPLLLVIDASGELVYKQLGYMNKNQLSKVMKKYAVSTKFMRKENLNYYKNQNYATGLRLAQKYIDYSQYLQEDIQAEFLGLASNYLKNGEKLLDKKQGNYHNMKDKIELMEIQIDLYQDKTNRVEKKLEKDFELSNLSKGNKILYTYLNYCISLKSHDNKAIDTWKKQLVSVDHSGAYLKKSELFLE